MAADNQIRYIKYTQTYQDKNGEMHDKMRLSDTQYNKNMHAKTNKKLKKPNLQIYPRSHVHQFSSQSWVRRWVSACLVRILVILMT